MDITPKEAARLLEGYVDGNGWINARGPNHSKRDRSMSVKLDPKAPEGFHVMSHASDDWRECRDYVRSKLGLPEWKPERKDGKIKSYTVESYVYEDTDGCDHWRVDHRSDGTFTHYHMDVDGWSVGQPKIAYPYRMSELRADEPVWVVYGERNAEMLSDGFGVNATTLPSGSDAHESASSFFHLKDVRILNAGGLRGRLFARKASEALSLPIWSLPDGYETLAEFACVKGASVDAFTCETIEGAVDADAIDTDTEEQPKSRFSITTYQRKDPRAIPRREWLYGRHLIRRFVSTTVSPGGLGKSSMVMVEALAMVSGKPLLGEAVWQKNLRVSYWNLEDPSDENDRRIEAAAIKYGLTDDDFGDRLGSDSGREQQITLAKMVRGEIQLDEDLFIEIEQQLIEGNYDVWTIDPFISAHQVNENDNGAIDAIIKRLGVVAERANVAIELVHHVRKPSGGDTGKTDVNDARGASALIGGVRSARVLNAMSAQEAEDYGIENRFSYFRVDNGKSNLAPKSNETKWRHIISVDLENAETLEESDKIGVVCPWTPPAAESLGPEALMIAQRIAYDTPELARADVKSSEWLGHSLAQQLGMDSLNDKDQRIIERAIYGWAQDGSLERENRKDASRKMRPYFACPERDKPLSAAIVGDVIEGDPNLF